MRTIPRARAAAIRAAAAARARPSCTGYIARRAPDRSRPWVPAPAQRQPGGAVV